MKTYFLKISVLSVLFVSLVPLAYARSNKPPIPGYKRTIEQAKESDTLNQKPGEANKTNPDVIQGVQIFKKDQTSSAEQGNAVGTEIHGKTPELSPAELLKLADARRETGPREADAGKPSTREGEGIFLEVGTQSVVLSARQVEDTLKSLGVGNNGHRGTLLGFMRNSDPSNQSISKELVDMAVTAVTAGQPLSPQARARAVQYVAHIANTSRTTVANGTQAGNVVRAVGNHLNKVASWSAKPRQTYNTFVRAFNEAKMEGASLDRAIGVAILRAFGKDTDVRAKRAQIARLCRV